VLAGPAEDEEPVEVEPVLPDAPPLVFAPDPDVRFGATVELCVPPSDSMVPWKQQLARAAAARTATS
jgi:hypothetical protein